MLHFILDAANKQELDLFGQLVVVIDQRVGREQGPEQVVCDLAVGRETIEISDVRAMVFLDVVQGDGEVGEESRVGCWFGLFLVVASLELAAGVVE